MTGEQLWIVCPSYADVLAFTMLRKRLLEVVDATPELAGRSVRFIVVDDTGGYDDEVEDLRSFGDVRVVTPPFNLGHQRALVCGLRVVVPQMDDSDLVVTMDADGEDRPEDLPRLLAPLIDAPRERKRLCVARRTARRESVGFRVMYFFFRILFRTVTGVTVRSGNFAAYRGWLARRMLLHPYFDLCYSSSLVSLDMPVTPIPCARGERYVGRSRMNILRLFIHGIRMLMPFTDRIAIRALVAFSSIFSVAFLLAAAVVATKVFTSTAIPGWTSTMLLGFLIVSFVAAGNFVVLFAVYSHSRGISMANLEDSLTSEARGGA